MTQLGILDNYFPEAHFFTEFERFDRHISKLERQNEGLDFISICSPNYLHDSHIRFVLSLRCKRDHVKTSVLNPWNIDGLREIENKTGNKVNTILQLRVHPKILALREKVNQTREKLNMRLT